MTAPGAAPRAALVALALALSGAAPFLRDEPHVKAGNEKLAAGDAAGALAAYDAAERAAGPRPEIDYDRGNALAALGRHAEARDAYRRALDRGAGALSSRALQNTGNALAALGDRDGAIGAFTEALRRDPRNEDARFDLEVLLRQRASGAPQAEEGKGKPEQGGEGQRRAGDQEQARQEPQQGAGERPRPAPGEQPGPQAGQPQAQGQRPVRGQARQEPRPGQAGQEPGPPEPGPRRGPAPRGEEPDRTAAADGERAGQEGDARQGGRQDGRMSRREAEQLLDALRARERNMPLAGTERQDGRRADDAKGW